MYIYVYMYIYMYIYIYIYIHIYIVHEDISIRREEGCDLWPTRNSDRTPLARATLMGIWSP